MIVTFTSEEKVLMLLRNKNYVVVFLFMLIEGLHTNCGAEGKVAIAGYG